LNNAKKKSSAPQLTKDDKIESLEDELYKIESKDEKQNNKSKKFRFSPKKKNKKGYSQLETEKTKNTEIEYVDKEE